MVAKLKHRFFYFCLVLEIFPGRLISLTLMALIFLDLGHSFGLSASLFIVIE